MHLLIPVIFALLISFVLLVLFGRPRNYRYCSFSWHRALNTFLFNVILVRIYNRRLRKHRPWLHVGARVEVGHTTWGWITGVTISLGKELHTRANDLTLIELLDGFRDDMIDARTENIYVKTAFNSRPTEVIVADVREAWKYDVSEWSID